MKTNWLRQRSSFSLRIIAWNYPHSSLSKDTWCQLWHHSQLQSPRQSIGLNGSVGPTIGQCLWHFTTGIKQITQQHMNHDNPHNDDPARCHSKRLGRTTDSKHGLSSQHLSFIHHSCLSYVTKIMKNPFLWYSTLKFALPHFISLQPRYQMHKSPSRNRNNLQISGK